MKKLLAIVLSVAMVLAFAAVSMASTIKTTGEIDVEGNYTDNTTLTEIGLYNDIAINDEVSAYIGFWMDSTSSSGALDDAYGTFKLGKGSLQLGYGRYNIDGPLDVLGNGNYLMTIMGGSLEPNVKALLTVPFGDNFTAKVGYFPNWGAGKTTTSGTVTVTTGYEADGTTPITADVPYTAVTGSTVGHDTVPVQLTLSAGPLTIDGTYLYLSKVNDTDTDAEYIADATCKLGQNAKVYVSYAGVNGAVTGADIVNFTFVGAQVNIGKLFVEGEYAVTVPDAIKDADTGSPFGAVISYQIDPNAKIKYTRWGNVAETAPGLGDRSRLECDFLF